MATTANCRNCGEPFELVTFWQRYCHSNCRTAAWHKTDRARRRAASSTKQLTG